MTNNTNNNENKDIHFGNAIASGMPEWTLEPPNIFVNRKKHNPNYATYKQEDEKENHIVSNTANQSKPVNLSYWNQLLENFKNGTDRISLIKAMQKETTSANIWNMLIDDVIPIVKTALKNNGEKIPHIFNKEAIDIELLQDVIYNLKEYLNILYQISKIQALLNIHRKQLEKVTRETATRLQDQINNNIRPDAPEEVKDFISKNNLTIFEEDSI